MRVAIAGLGAASVRGHLPALARLGSERVLRLVGAADPNVERRTAVATRLCGLPVFDSTEAMLASVRSDVLIVASEPSMHARLAALGVRHGQHVVCEKPLALTRAHQEDVADAYSGAIDRALVSVHQYRYSPTWVSLSSRARLLARSRTPFELTVSIERDGTDRHAVTPWRADLTKSGGMLADHGVHFLALAWTIDKALEVLSVERTVDRGGRERSRARLRLASGDLEIHLSAAARERHTRVDLTAATVTWSWIDDRVVLRLNESVVDSRRSDALSDRRHVDALYEPFYRHLVANLQNDSWRMRRWSEALGVSSALVTLLDHLQTGRAAA
jgi:predicted dehydrogenase